MNKSILLTVLLFTITHSVKAQFLQFGVKGGLNYANLTGTTVQTDAITSYHIGIISEIKLLEKFALQPELLYTTQGASYHTIPGDVKNELGYIAIPVLAKIYLSKSFSLEIGPQASFLLSEKNNFDVNNANTFDFAIDAGLGFKITKNIFIQGRYVLGLTEVSSNAETKNSVIQLSAGILF